MYTQRNVTFYFLLGSTLTEDSHENESHPEEHRNHRNHNTKIHFILCII